MRSTRPEIRRTTREPARSATAVQQVIRELEDGIRTGRFAPGQRLVEGDLTVALGVSRGPLREALGRLAAEGLIDIEPYRGAVVRRLTRKDVRDLYQVREVLEGEAARLAALAIDEGHNRRRLTAAAKGLSAFKKRMDVLSYLDRNAEFHDLVVELSGNDLLRTLLPRLHTHAFRLLFRNLLSPAAAQESLRHHDAIVEAIQAGDARGAERAMREHVRRSGQAIQQLPDHVFA